MKERIKHWLIPPGIQHLLKKKSSGIEKFVIAGTTNNVQFKGRHTGKRCFILASGPSIKEQNLLPLQNEICIAVSSFFHHPDINIIKPRYHVLAPVHPPFGFKEASIIINGLNKEYEYPLDLFIGSTSFKFSHNEYLKTHTVKHTVHFINYEGSPNLDDSNRDDEGLWDITQTPFLIRTVVFSAIQIAVYMGFKEIYLLGCDHDFLQRIGQYEGRHFYESSKSFSDEKHLKEFTLEKMFLGHYLTWRAYRNMKEHLEPMDVKIYNTTKGGMLDVFERVELDSLFNNTNAPK